MANEEMVEHLDEVIDKIERRAGELVDMEQTFPLPKEDHERFIIGIGDAYFTLGLLKNSRAMFSVGGGEKDEEVGENESENTEVKSIGIND